MKREIRYLELKSGFGDRGPAWIAEVEFSKSGQTVYFNNKALKKGLGYSGNHFDIETGEEWWVSGVKKNGQDRHWAGGGKIMIDKAVIPQYLKIVDFSTLPEKHFTVVSLDQNFDKSRFNTLENEAVKNTPILLRSDERSYWDDNKRRLIAGQ